MQQNMLDFSSHGVVRRSYICEQVIPCSQTTTGLQIDICGLVILCSQTTTELHAVMSDKPTLITAEFDSVLPIHHKFLYKIHQAIRVCTRPQEIIN
jgi:hypothetical protein